MVCHSTYRGVIIVESMGQYLSHCGVYWVETDMNNTTCSRIFLREDMSPVVALGTAGCVTALGCHHKALDYVLDTLKEPKDIISKQ